MEHLQRQNILNPDLRFTPTVPDQASQQRAAEALLRDYVRTQQAEWERTDPLSEADAALKALREAKDKEGQRRATEALEKALEKLKQRQAGGKKAPEGGERPW
jgi:hypothetical protein